jgi:hypothetical protein
MCQAGRIHKLVSGFGVSKMLEVLLLLLLYPIPAVTLLQALLLTERHDSVFSERRIRDIYSH